MFAGSDGGVREERAKRGVAVIDHGRDVQLLRTCLAETAFGKGQVLGIMRKTQILPRLLNMLAGQPLLVDVERNQVGDQVLHPGQLGQMRTLVQGFGNALLMPTVPVQRPRDVGYGNIRQAGLHVETPVRRELQILDLGAGGRQRGLQNGAAPENTAHIQNDVLYPEESGKKLPARHGEIPKEDTGLYIVDIGCIAAPDLVPLAIDLPGIAEAQSRSGCFQDTDRFAKKARGANVIRLRDPDIVAAAEVEPLAPLLRQAAAIDRN